MIETPVYAMLWDAAGKTERFVSSCGGTRSGKTYSALQLLIKLACLDKIPSITSVVSETMPHLKRGAIRDFKSIMGNKWDDNAWNKTDCVYRFPNGSIIEFFSADSPAKVHGPARDRLFINEAQNVPYEIARQLFVRTTGLIVIDYNPTHSFWVNEKIEPQENCTRIHSTYKDNTCLSPLQVREIESNRNDANWWKVYGEGKVGTLEGVIFSDIDIIDKMPEQGNMVETYGMDFGFTNDPTVCVHSYIDTARKDIYLDEVFYARGMLNADIISEMRKEGVQPHTMVFCDCAEPKTIEELYQAGYNALPCYKATRKAEQLQIMRGYRIHITKRSTNGIKELRNYTWAKDKDGNMLNEPIAHDDHFCDAMRYANISYLVEYEGSRLVVGFSDDYI